MYIVLNLPRNCKAGLSFVSIFFVCLYSFRTIISTVYLISTEPRIFHSKMFSVQKEQKFVICFRRMGLQFEEEKCRIVKQIVRATLIRDNVERIITFKNSHGIAHTHKHTHKLQMKEESAFNFSRRIKTAL